MWGARPPGVHVPYRGGRKGAESAPNTDRTPRRERPGAAPLRRGDRPVLTGVQDTPRRYEAGEHGPYPRVVARKGPRRPRPLTHGARKDPGYRRDGPASAALPRPRPQLVIPEPPRRYRAERRERPRGRRRPPECRAGGPTIAGPTPVAPFRPNHFR